MKVNFIKTLNNMGYMTTELDSYTKEFINFCDSDKVVLEAGSAFGVATVPILETGARVVVNDLDQRHLEDILSGLQENTKKRFILKPGPIQDLTFEKEQFDGVFTSRMLHLLKGDDIEKVLTNFYYSLRQEGLIVIIVDTPFLGSYSENLPNYNKLCENGDMWPGLIPDTSKFMKIYHNNIPKFINFIDLPTLERVVSNSGFSIKKSGYITQTSFPKELQMDGRESAGIVAIKH